MLAPAVHPWLGGGLIAVARFPRVIRRATERRVMRPDRAVIQIDPLELPGVPWGGD